MQHSDDSVRFCRDLRKIEEILEKEVAKLENEAKSLKTETQFLQKSFEELSSRALRGIRSANGSLFPLISFSQLNPEEATASFRIDEDKISISVTCNDEQEIIQTKVDLSLAPMLWEVKDHLLSLEVYNNPQSIMLDIVAFHDLDRCREDVLSSLQHGGPGISVEVPQALNDNCDRSPIIKAFNPQTSEIFFELKWSIVFCKSYVTFCHNFLYKCKPREKSDNADIISLIQSLDDSTFWMENQKDLVTLWQKICDKVKGCGGLQ